MKTIKFHFVTHLVFSLVGIYYFLEMMQHLFVVCSTIYYFLFVGKYMNFHFI
jgi:hypothetical protein